MLVKGASEREVMSLWQIIPVDILHCFTPVFVAGVLWYFMAEGITGFRPVNEIWDKRNTHGQRIWAVVSVSKAQWQAVLSLIAKCYTLYYTCNIVREILSFRQNVLHRLHQKLSQWQFAVQSVIKILLRWYYLMIIFLAVASSFIDGFVVSASEQDIW